MWKRYVWENEKTFSPAAAGLMISGCGVFSALGHIDGKADVPSFKTNLPLEDIGHLKTRESLQPWVDPDTGKEMFATRQILQP